MTTTAEIATVPQINVIKGLSNSIWGSEWIVLDEYGDSDGVVDRVMAGNLIVALNEVKRLPLTQLDDGQKLEALTKALAGDTLDEFRVVAPQEPEAEPPVEKLIDDILDVGPPIAAPAWERFEIADSADSTKEDTTDTTTKKQRALKPIEHGTPNGYANHRQRGEEACDACKAAIAKYSRERDAKKRAGSRPQATPKPKKAAAKRAATPKARSNGARNSAQVEVAEPQSIDDWDSRFYDIVIGGLVKMLPTGPTDHFPAENQDKWLRFATAVLPLVWPNS